ncbi:MAG: polymer-forming cytoskeletal protein [Woeseia sp.]
MNEPKKRRLRDASGGPATLISEGCKITGKLEGSGDFMISGEIDGDSDLAGTVTLTRKGAWTGTLKAGAVVIAGRVKGNVVSTGHIEIGDTANIDGTVTGSTIAVAAGAIVQGRMSTTVAKAPVEFIEKRGKP